jgi:hypothetical protein
MVHPLFAEFKAVRLSSLFSLEDDARNLIDSSYGCEKEKNRQGDTFPTSAKKSRSRR